MHVFWSQWGCNIVLKCFTRERSLDAYHLILLTSKVDFLSYLCSFTYVMPYTLYCRRESWKQRSAMVLGTVHSSDCELVSASSEKCFADTHLNETHMKWELLKDSHGFPKGSLQGNGNLFWSAGRKEDKCFVRHYRRPKWMADTSLIFYSCKTSSSIWRTRYVTLASFWDLY